MESSAPANLNIVQQNLIRTFEFLHNEQQLVELNSLINFYFEKKLDDAIKKAEKYNNYTAEIYEEWLKEQNRTSSKADDANFRTPCLMPLNQVFQRITSQIVPKGSLREK